MRGPIQLLLSPAKVKNIHSNRSYAPCHIPNESSRFALRYPLDWLSVSVVWEKTIKHISDGLHYRVIIESAAMLYGNSWFSSRIRCRQSPSTTLGFNCNTHLEPVIVSESATTNALAETINQHNVVSLAPVAAVICWIIAEEELQLKFLFQKW